MTWWRNKTGKFKVDSGGIATCPVCGIRRQMSNMRTHIAKSAQGEKLRGNYGEHFAFYMDNTDEEIIVRRKWKI